MDGSGALNCPRVYRDSPGAAFVFAGGEEGNQAKQSISFADEAGEAALSESVAGEEFGGIGVAHFGKLGLDLAADGSRAGVGAGCDFGQSVFGNRGVQVFSQFRALADIQHVKNRLLAQEHESAKTLL